MPSVIRPPSCPCCRCNCAVYSIDGVNDLHFTERRMNITRGGIFFMKMNSSAAICSWMQQSPPHTALWTLVCALVISFPCSSAVNQGCSSHDTCQHTACNRQVYLKENITIISADWSSVGGTYLQTDPCPMDAGQQPHTCCCFETGSVPLLLSPR